jgi:putative Mg2+ transporter-C (MgtC) family protein
LERQWRQRTAGTTYEVNPTVRSSDEAHLRTLLLTTISQSTSVLQAMHSSDIENSDRMEIRPVLTLEGRRNEVVEQVLNRLSFEPGVSAVSWSIVLMVLE